MKKIIINTIMLVLIIMEFSKVYLPSVIHELIGILLFVFVIIHLYQNKNYFKTIFQKNNDRKKTALMMVNSVLMLSFLLTMIFGILSSKDLLKFFNIHSIYIVKLHKTISYYCLLFLGMHMGLNYEAMFGKIEKKIKNKMVILIPKIIIVLLGIYSWIKVDFWKRIIGKYGFSKLDKNLLICVIEYVLIVLMICIIVHFIVKKIEDKKGKH